MFVISLYFSARISTLVSIIMKNLLTILLLSLLSVISTGNQETAPARTGEDKDVACTLKESSRENIAELSDRLNNCRFETPQTTNVNITSRNQQQTPRQWHENPRCTFASAYVPTTHNRHILKNVRTAIATSRHSRGYYIYVLRHIII